MGMDKAWLDLGGRAMIEHVIAELLPATDRLAIIANSPEYARLGHPIFADSNPDIGPLEAIRTALLNALTPRVVLVGCDLPFVTTDLFRLLLSAPGDQHATVPIGPDGRLEPLCAIYRAEALPVVTDLISQGERKVSFLFNRIPTRFVPFQELTHLTGSELFFENINTPEDYDRAKDVLRTSRDGLVP